MAEAPRKRVAVIGSGIAGMTAAYQLAEKYDIVIYEAADGPGMDAQSINLGECSGHRVDVPIRSFSPHYYPNLLRLYREIGVQLQEVNYCQSLSEFGGETLFQYSNITFAGFSVPFTNPFKNWRFLAEFLRFQGRCWWNVNDATLPHITFDEFMKRTPHSQVFYESFLLPICSSMLSCKMETVRNYPADIIVQFFGIRKTTLLTGWLRVADGATDICQRLLAPVAEAKRLYETKVNSVRSVEGGVEVVDAKGKRCVFDEVVVATEAVHALGMLKDASAEETKILSAFKYEESTACVHRDAAIMPSEKSNWRTMNSFLPPGEHYTDRPPIPSRYSMSCVSVWMNQLVDVPPAMGDVFQTWNPLVEPAEDKILSKAYFQRAVHTLDSSKALYDLPSIQGKRGIWFCGSYASHGMTLLEQAVSSTLSVTTSLECPPSWDHLHPEPPTSLTNCLLPILSIIGVGLAVRHYAGRE